MGVGCAGVHLQLAQHRVAERSLGQHAFHGFLQNALRLRGVQLGEVGLLDAAGEFGMPVVDLALGLAAGDAQFRHVDDHDEVAGIDVRGVLGLMFAAQTRGDLGGEPAEHFALRVHYDPAVLDFARFCGKCSHVARIEKSCEFYPKKRRRSQELRLII